MQNYGQLFTLHFFRIVCTDALARGIDLPGVQCVISYSAPKHLKTYIHRAGRTARAGSSGTAVTLLHTTQVGHFKSLLKHAEKTNVEEVCIIFFLSDRNDFDYNEP